jgi:hypothetical protein
VPVSAGAGIREPTEPKHTTFPDRSCNAPDIEKQTIAESPKAGTVRDESASLRIRGSSFPFSTPELWMEFACGGQKETKSVRITTIVTPCSFQTGYSTDLGDLKREIRILPALGGGDARQPVGDDLLSGRDGLLQRHVRGVQNHRIGGGDKGRIGAVAVAAIALA